MNILIVDDQGSVVSGIEKAIDWKEITIKNVFKAYNAWDAKEIIKNTVINIMLCDIEMPQENGIELFRWIKQEKYDIECIFLTAHADFEFAREAIRLGGFDYILQPAPYEDVKKAIVNAKRKIQAKKEAEQYSSYGKVLYSQKNTIISASVKKILFDTSTNLKDIVTNLERFQVYLSKKNRVCSGIIHILRHQERAKEVEGDLLCDVFGNILSELMEKNFYKILITQSGEAEFSFLIYSEPSEIDRNNIAQILESFILIGKDLLKLEIACYLGNVVILEEIKCNNDIVLALKQENIFLLTKVFLPKRRNLLEQVSDTGISIKEWKQMLVGGNTQLFHKEACQVLENTLLGSHGLKRFYQDFMKVLAGAEEEIGVSNYQLFNEKEKLEQFLTAYDSIEKMRDLIDYVSAYFKEATKKDDSNYVEIVIQYININIEKEIRRNEIASAVNLNEDYIARIFKKERGISLKEFIILEKMKVAKNLLKNTKFSIGTIATKVGFTNFSHFSQMYKKTMGVTPAEERKSEK